MLDPANPQPLDLTSFETYIQSCQELVNRRLDRFAGPKQVAEQEKELNQYPRLPLLEEPRDIMVVDERSINAAQVRRAADTFVRGGVLLEHACAGEATRLGLGAKYLLNPRRDLSDELLARLLGQDHDLKHHPRGLRPLSLGRRHMLQMAWDLWHLALEMGQDPKEVLSRQHLLIIMNQKSAAAILEDFRQASFYGFDPRQVLFMEQMPFHGFNRQEGRWFYDTASPKRLHNHGQMLMQTTMDGQLYTIDGSGRRSHLSWQDFHGLLSDLEDKVSYNIEDLDFLSRSLDLTGLAAASKLAEQGARMVMEVVTNNPKAPIKGGACYWDPELARNVIIESFQLKGIEPRDIKFLNKNINHYPHPAQGLAALREQGLSMPLVVKKDFLYFQPVQGDLNFLVPTAYLRRSRLKSISAWKSGEHTPEALEAMTMQERRPGFLAWAAGLTGLAL